MTQPGVEPDRINIKHPASCAQWSKKLDVTDEQLQEAVNVVGDKASDVELHLKGARSTTNADRVRELRGA